MFKLLASILTLGSLLLGCSATRTGGWKSAPHPEASGPARFRVLTLNTAHGVRQPALSFLANRGVIEGNLRSMALTLAREDADVVALQEVHARRHRTGGPLDQLEVLAAHAGYGHRYFGTHYERPMLEARRGTALLSKTQLASPSSTAFKVGPGDDHGWVVATIRPEGFLGIEVDVVSVHLDPYSPRRRVEQMDALVAAFEDRVRPLVVMGDFNADWGGRDGVERVAARLGLKAFQPTHGERTFPSPLPLVRVDWILVSPELRILRHRTFREAATDHLGVVADLGLSPRIWARVQGQQTRVRLAEEARLGDAPVLAVAAAQEDPASTAAGGDAPAANQVESASPAAIAPRPLSARPSTKRRERGALLVQTSAPGGSEEEVGPRQQAQPQAPAATQQSRTEPEPDETPDPVASRPSVDLPVRASEWTARVARVDPRLAQPEAPEDGEPSTDGAAGRR